MSTVSVPDLPTISLLRTLVSALEDKKADQLKVLHVSGVSNITDYLVLATGNSEPHLRALRIEAEKVLDAAKVKIAGMEQGGFNSGWTVVDAYQVMVHLFTPEQRQHYALDKLWKDAAEVDLKTFETKAAAAPKTVAKKTKVTAPKKAAKKKVTPDKAKAMAKKSPPKKAAAKTKPATVVKPKSKVAKVAAKPAKKAEK
ncbi:MAG: ribosome silencing factor [Verrucomicrobia bacterium]|nr:ribosome silencing factor [Verrucomicrobiota bacterium]